MLTRSSGTSQEQPSLDVIGRSKPKLQVQGLGYLILVLYITLSQGLGLFILLLRITEMFHTTPTHALTLDPKCIEL